jgi:uncharacterized protein with HEPN domain
MDRGDIERIKHIKRYCEDIAGTVVRFGNSFETFDGDIDFYNSVSMSIMQIGELANGLSDDFKDATRTQMPWSLMKGMRNIFAHAYATMEKKDIWETATADIPNLLRFCDGIIEQNLREHDQETTPRDRERGR